ncbi:unnamed protein product [Sphagnum troendelagicum]|uniref:Uncharacterized protein n=1 Tax=Sphagnum troendelagicum TaxID=128251 RepID=A0ABP0TLG5_9BRYO
MGDSAYSPRDPSGHILEKSYDMQRILNSLVRAGDHVGDASASSVHLMEESSVRGEQRQGASSPAAFPKIIIPVLARNFGKIDHIELMSNS